MNTDQLLEGFRSDLQLKGQSEATISIYSWQIEKFAKFLDGSTMDFSMIDKEDIKSYLAYLRSKNIKHKSISLYFSGLSSFFDFLEEEGLITTNLVRPVRKRYLKVYKTEKNERKIISIKDAIRLVNSILDTRDKTIVLLLLKTGIRRKELVELDLDDLNFDDASITLKPTPKRSNRIVFFDPETANQLKRWIRVRESWVSSKNKILFVDRQGLRLSGRYIHEKVAGYASFIGLHDPNSKKLADRFTPHCCRHFFTTHLRRSGMPREFIQELRGDVRREAIDIYDHIDKDELKQSYLDYIPKFGI